MSNCSKPPVWNVRTRIILETLPNTSRILEQIAFQFKYVTLNQLYSSLGKKWALDLLNFENIDSNEAYTLIQMIERTRKGIWMNLEMEELPLIRIERNYRKPHVGPLEYLLNGQDKPI